MNAYQVVGFGGIDQLVPVNLEVPKLGVDEVLVKVCATALNNSDIWMRKGAYGTETSEGNLAGWKREGIHFPRIPGSDIAGEIVEVGRHVNINNLNRKVVLFPFQSTGEKGFEHLSDDIGYLGSEFDGGYAQYVVWKADLCFNMPLASFQESAAFPVSGLTAWHMIKRANLTLGEKVLITGATGGVGSVAIQIASKVFGAKVIACVRDQSMREKMEQLGAHDIVSYKSKNIVVDIHKIAGGKVDVVLDVVGDALFTTAINCLRKGGRLVTSGASSGPLTNVDLRSIYLKQIDILGSTLGTREEFSELLLAVSRKKVKPIIDRVFPLNEARNAQVYFEKSKKTGKVLLCPNS